MKMKTKKSFLLIILSVTTVILTSCYTPSRLGMSYQDEQIRSSNYVDCKNIEFHVGNLTKEDNKSDINLLKYRFVSNVNRNISLNNIMTNYPNAKLIMEIDPSEEIKKTWILDILFFYPGCGYLLPITPWWGTVNLKSNMSLTIPNIINKDLSFNSSMPFQILSYPYYIAGKKLPGLEALK